MEDSVSALRYVVRRFPGHRLVLWGHSLGTAVALATASKAGSSSCPCVCSCSHSYSIPQAASYLPATTTLVLEAPFFKLEDAIKFELRNGNPALLTFTPWNLLVKITDTQFR